MTSGLKQQGLRELRFITFAVGIGVLAAAGAMGFRALIEIFQDLFWEPGSTFLEKVVHSPWWLRVSVPLLVGLLAGPVITFLVPEARGPGVPEVIVSVVMRQSTIRHRVTLLKAFVTSLLIGGGASVGREGPIVQIGASIGSSMAQIFRLDPSLRRVCLASGAAAGIAATFNAPMAGTLFAVEIILMDIEVAHISHIIISAITASVFSRIFLGEFPAFKVSGFQLTYHWELGIYLVLGLLAGLVSIVFIRMISVMDGLFRRLPLFEWIKPGFGGLLLGLMALKFPFVMGVGYETTNLALAGSLVLKMAVLTLFMKMAATSLCIGSGMSGGIFAPSLVLGSMLGAVVELTAIGLLPDFGLNPGNYALAGMGAVVAGTTLAPITAILTIFELTYSYRIILPLMVACIAATLVVKLLFGYSAYEMKLLKQGINLVRGHDVSILRSLYAGDFMHRQFESLRDSTPLPEIVERSIQSVYPHFVVLDREGKLAGVLSLRDLKASLDNFETLRDVLIAADLMTRNVIALSYSDTLEEALHLFEKHHVSFVPVIDPLNGKNVLGILKKDDLLRAYQEKVLKDRILSCSI